LAIEIADFLFDLADDLEKKRLFKFAEQLRGSGMSMSNNISEGSGSTSKKEFKQFGPIRSFMSPNNQFSKNPDMKQGFNFFSVMFVNALRSASSDFNALRSALCAQRF